MILNEQQIRKLNEWLAKNGELYADVYLPNSGRGGTGYFLCSIQDLEDLIVQQTWPSLAITVFRRLQYPLRGIADENLLLQALKSFPDDWYSVLLISDEGYYPSGVIQVGSGDSHQDLKQEFPEFRGLMVAIGQNPFDSNTDWIEQTPSEVMVLKLKRIEGQYKAGDSSIGYG